MLLHQRRLLATAADGDEAIKLWDVDTWPELITLPHRKLKLQALLFSPDGNQLAARTSQGDLLFWRAPSLSDIEQREAQQARAK